MGLLSIVPLLASVLYPSGMDNMMVFRQCQQEGDAQVRLACYDALARYQSAPGEQKAAPEKIVPVAASDEGWRKKEIADSNITLERTVGNGAVFSVSCLDQITHVRVRLVQSWKGEDVTAAVDGMPASGNWFVRDNGHLLEFGRGLVAIDELKRWVRLSELTLGDGNGREVRIPLDGLGEAVKPLRLQCRW